MIKGNNSRDENEIKIIQVNPKLRLFILIFSNWLMTVSFIIVGGGWASWAVRMPWFFHHFYVIWILFGCFVVTSFLFFYCLLNTGIKYFPKDLREHYVRKNNQQLQEIKNLEINNVTQEFNVIPICDEVYSEKQNFETRTKKEFSGLSGIEESQNRLVVNGKINNLNFSWGIVTKVKKNSLKLFLWILLCFGPIGIIVGFFTPSLVNADLSKKTKTTGVRKYKKLGADDVFSKKSGKLNSENYLIFSAKLKNSSDLITLIPKSNERELINFNAQYDWPTNISLTQKATLQNLIQEMSFLPSIYLYQDTISIVMKKYRYNNQDNRELQTWELIKDSHADSEIQFNYLNQAIKIYQIFNEKEE